MKTVTFKLELTMNVPPFDSLVQEESTLNDSETYKHIYKVLSKIGGFKELVCESVEQGLIIDETETMVGLGGLYIDKVDAE